MRWRERAHEKSCWSSIGVVVLFPKRLYFRTNPSAVIPVVRPQSSPAEEETQRPSKLLVLANL